jgi:hypothetical protein
MFGYIKPYVPQLRVSEHECWRAVYCGLCKCMGRHICADSTLALSYDAAFLALFRLAATGEEIHFTNRRCALHPAKKRPMLDSCEALRYSASVSALLVYHKLADDVADEGRFSHRLLMPEARRLHRKAKLPELDRALTERLNKFYETEKNAANGDASASADKLAELSGSATALIFSSGLEGVAARVASELGRRVGRWVYFTDAVADREKDAKTGAFNPFASNFDRDSIAAALALERRAAEGALNLLGCSDTGIESILRNIITLGMGMSEEKALGGIVKSPKS